MGEARAVEVGGGDDLRLEQLFLAGEFELRELGGGAGLGEAGREGGEFARARTFFQVGEPGLRGAELVGGLLLGGELVGAFEGEERGGGGDARALGDGEGVEPAGEGRGDVDEFAFEVALPAVGRRAAARGDEENDERGGEGWEKRAAHEVTTGSAGGNLQGRKRRARLGGRLSNPFSGGPASVSGRPRPASRLISRR